MILKNNVAERKKRDRLGNAGAAILMLTSVVMPPDILTRSPVLAALVHTVADSVPFIRRFAPIAQAPESASLVLTLMILLIPIVAIPWTILQIKIQDFKRTRPAVKWFGWGMAFFLAMPWFIEPYRPGTQRSQLMVDLLSSGSVGVGCFSVAFYFLLVVSWAVTVISLVALFRRD